MSNKYASRLMSQKPAHIDKSNKTENLLKVSRFTIFWYKFPNGTAPRDDLTQGASTYRNNQVLINDESTAILVMLRICLLNPDTNTLTWQLPLGSLRLDPTKSVLRICLCWKNNWTNMSMVTTYSILYCILEVSGLGDRCDWIVLVYPGRHRSNSLRLLP